MVKRKASLPQNFPEIRSVPRRESQTSRLPFPRHRLSTHHHVALNLHPFCEHVLQVPSANIMAMRSTISIPVSNIIEDECDPSSQLLSTLQESVRQALSTRRPLLTHPNSDTTWLLSLPYPPSAARPPNRRERVYYHILIDPWLRGGQSDVARFFSQQWHKEESAVQTIGEVKML